MARNIDGNSASPSDSATRGGLPEEGGVLFRLRFPDGTLSHLRNIIIISKQRTRRRKSWCWIPGTPTVRWSGFLRLTFDLPVFDSGVCWCFRYSDVGNLGRYAAYAESVNLGYKTYSYLVEMKMVGDLEGKGNLNLHK